MPIREYHCDKCDKDIEWLQKMNEPALYECPECGSPDFHRILSSSSFSIKGKGVYKQGFNSNHKVKKE